MDLQRRIEIPITDTENVAKIGNTKGIVKPFKVPLTRRPALGEVGNKIHAQNVAINNAKKGAVTNKSEVVLKDIKKPKPTTFITKKLTTTTTTTATNIKATSTKTETVATKKVETTKELNKHDTVLNSLINEESKIEETISSYSSQQLKIIDPDINDKEAPQMVTEYVPEIFNYLKELELKYPINEKFLEAHQTTPKMRAILVNWLIEVHLNFKSCLETLHLCISIIDRYLQFNKQTSRQTLQLVGTAAMLVACKYEEMYLPELDDFVYICDNTFTKRQILRMEIEILKKLDFNLGKPLSVHFLRRYSKVAQVGGEEHTLAKYLLELALLDHNLSCVNPSLQAASACCLSTSILNEYNDPVKAWTDTLVYYTNYEYKDLKSVIVKFAHLVMNADTQKHQAIYKKYAHSKYGKISLNLKIKGRLVRKLTSALTPTLISK